jgi:hypothetical protein
VIEILLVALWGAVVLAAIDGYGGLASRLAPAIPVDAGLRLSWGIAVFLAVGGVLTAFSLATRPMVMTAVAAGALLSLVRFRKEPRLSWMGWMGCAVALILTLHYLGQVAGVREVCADDHLAYWGFIKRQLALGAADEPFSLRRLAGHGGQMFLQSLVVANGGLENAFLIELGISPIIIYLLLRGALPGRAPALPALALTMTLVTLIYEFNSQSVCTGVVLFLGLARTLVAMDAPIQSRAGELLLLGLMVAGLSSLRVHFLLGAALTVAAWLLSGWRGVRTLPDLSWRAAILLCGSLLFFTPWMAGLWRSSETPLFPLFAGTGAGGYDAFSESGTRFYDLALKYATASDGLFLFLPVLAFWRPAPERRVLIISYAVALLMTMLMSWRFPSADSWNLGRYMWPMVAVPVLLSLIIVIRGARLTNAGPRVLVALLLGCFAVSGLRLGLDTMQLARALDPNATVEETRLAELHRQLQDLVPVNERLLVATDNPYLVDYRRNRTWNIDLPGAASLPPGLPFFHGPQAVQDYLLAQGVHYVLFADGMQAHPCLVVLPRDSGPRMKSSSALWQLQGRYILDFLDNMNQLAARDTVLARKGHYVVMHLDNH